MYNISHMFIGNNSNSDLLQWISVLLILIICVIMFVLNIIADKKENENVRDKEHNDSDRGIYKNEEGSKEV